MLTYGAGQADAGKQLATARNVATEMQLLDRGTLDKASLG